MNRFLNAVFLSFIFIFSALFFLGVGSEDISSIEKRELRDIPALSNTDINYLPDAYSEYISDHFPLSRRLSKVISLMSYKLFNSVRSDSVAVGRNGFLFLKSELDTDPLSDYRGTNAFSDEELAEISSSLERLKEQCEKRGQTLIFVIIPNKEDVYSSYLPGYFKKVSAPARKDQVTQLIKESGIILVDPTPAFKDTAKDDDTLYFKADTHWTGKGAYICMDMLLDAMNIAHVPYRDNAFSEGDYYESDIANLCNLYDLYADNRDLVPAAEPVDAQSQITVSLVGDSFSWRLQEYMDVCFEEVYCHSFSVNGSELAREASDYLVIEIVERNLGKLGGVIDRCL